MGEQFFNVGKSLKKFLDFLCKKIQFAPPHFILPLPALLLLPTHICPEQKLQLAAGIVKRRNLSLTVEISSEEAMKEERREEPWPESPFMKFIFALELARRMLCRKTSRSKKMVRTHVPGYELYYRNARSPVDFIIIRGNAVKFHHSHGFSLIFQVFSRL